MAVAVAAAAAHLLPAQPPVRALSLPVVQLPTAAAAAAHPLLGSGPPPCPQLVQESTQLALVNLQASSEVAVHEYDHMQAVLRW